MKKTLYDVAVKGEGGKWYPIAVVSTRGAAAKAYADWVALGGIKGDVQVTKRTHFLF